MPRRGLDRAAVVEAAAALADEVGLDGLTLAGVAERLGVRSPSLFNHLPNGLEGLRRELALLGSGIAHSLSPPTWNGVFAELGLPWRYGLLDVGPEGLDDALARLRDGRTWGYNVTMPHKAWAFGVATRPDDRAQRGRVANWLAADGQDMLDRVARFPKPVAVGIHGACLGGGFEFALACHYRVATDHPRTQIGLPEIQLGILPGAGGCQRLPRLVGVRAALDMILAGKSERAQKAFRLGMRMIFLILEYRARSIAGMHPTSALPKTVRAPRE